MSVVLQEKFATAEDTAAVLGVAKSRLRRLLRIAGPSSEFSKRLAFKARSNGAGTPRAQGKVTRSTKRRKHTRGKAKKVAR